MERIFKKRRICRSEPVEDAELAPKIDVEHALRDAMYIVVSYLDFKDLDSVSKVCKSWRVEALREKEKRCCIEMLHLPHNFDNQNSKLFVEPCVSLLFSNSESYYRRQMLNEQTIESVRKQSHKSMVLQFDDCLTSREVEGYVEEGLCKVRGLFIPNSEAAVRVHVACGPPIPRELLPVTNPNLNKPADQDATLVHRVANDLAENLRLQDYRKSTLLLFTNDIIVAPHIIKLLETRIPESTKVTVVKIKCHKMFNNYQADNNDIGMVALNIAGPNMDSWATEMKIHLPIEEFEQKLLELKERVKLRRYSTGIYYGFKCDEHHCNHNDHPFSNSHKIMRILKRFFPGVQFVGAFETKTVVWPLYRRYQRTLGERCETTGLVIISSD